MSKYIDADKLIAEIEKRAKFHDDAMKACIGLNNIAITHSAGWKEDIELLAIITSLQQEQPEEMKDDEKIMNFFDALGDCGFSQHDILLLKNIWKEAGCPLPKSQVADASKMEQEVDYSEFEKAITKYRPQSGSQEIMTRAEEAALKAYPNVEQPVWDKSYPKTLFVRHVERNAFIKGYEQAEQDIISIIESRISEILGDAQPNPTLRAELRDLINKLKEEQE